MGEENSLIKESIRQLKEEKSNLNNRIFYINQEIYKLQTQCTHDPNDVEYSGERVLEPRWAYEMAYSYDKTGERIIETRSAICSVCHKSWTEMRFTDSEWMESMVWQNAQRSGSNEHC